MTTFLKDPSAVLDFEVSWSAWLDGDTITMSTWTVETGITKDSDSHTDTTAKIWLSGGTAGERYLLTNRIVTTGGRTDERSLYIKVMDR